jgi:hypothetical protein
MLYFLAIVAALLLVTYAAWRFLSKKKKRRASVPEWARYYGRLDQ